jgi:hypothetical protein
LPGDLQPGLALAARSLDSSLHFPNSLLPSFAGLAKAAEGFFLVDDVRNFGPHYDPTLMAWEENFRRAWPRFAEQYDERFFRMWRFYLLSCAGAFRARSLQVYSILFAREGSPARDSRSRPGAEYSEQPPKEEAGSVRYRGEAIASR